LWIPRKRIRKAPAEVPAAPVEQPEVDAPDRQLFFSTDGSESEEERPRPEEEKEVKNVEEKSPDQPKPAKQEKTDGGRRGGRGTTSGKLESFGAGPW
jgi:hypothetical protein